MYHPRPTAWEQLKQSRKFLVFLIVSIPLGVGVILATVAIVIAMIRRSISLEAGVGLITGSLFLGTMGAVAMAWKVADGITKEDVARIEAGAPKPPLVGAIATGEGAKASSNVTGAPSDAAGEVRTDPGESGQGGQSAPASQAYTVERAGVSEGDSASGQAEKSVDVEIDRSDKV